MTLQSWNGQTLTLDYDYPAYGSLDGATSFVANGSTYAADSATFYFDVSFISSHEEQIAVTGWFGYGYWSSASFNGPVFVGPSGDLPISGVTLAATTMAGLTQSDLSYTGNSVAVNWQGLSFVPSTTVTIDVFFGDAPSVSAATPSTVERGQSEVIGTAAPGVAGDTLTLAQTGGSGSLSLVTVNGTEDIVYTAPASLAASRVDTVGYTVTDVQQGTTAAATQNVQLDAGPAIAAATPVPVLAGQTTVVGTVTPGLSGDILTLSQAPGARGTLSLGPPQSNGAQSVIYTAPTGIAATAVDVVSYTVTDQHDDATAAGSASVTLEPPALPTLVWAAGTTGAWTTAADWTPSGVPGAGEEAIVDGSGYQLVTITAPVSVAGIDLTGSATSYAGLSVSSQLDVSAAIVLANPTDGAAANTDDDEELLVLGGATVVAQGLTVGTQGQVDIYAGSIISAAIVNDGVFVESGSYGQGATIDGAISGTGEMIVAYAHTLELNGAVAGQTVDVDGGSLFKLDQPAAFSGTIELSDANSYVAGGFGTDDTGSTIDLASVAVSSVTQNGSTLTVHETNGGTLNLQVYYQPQGGNLLPFSDPSGYFPVAASDGHGGTDISYVPPEYTGTGGPWTNAASWLDGVLPVSGNDAVLDPQSNQTTITLAAAAALNQLLFYKAGITLANASTLTVGALELGTDTISGGVVASAGGLLDAEGGTLGHATLAGAFTLDFGSELNASGGITFTGLHGTGPGLLSIAPEAGLFLDGTADSLSNATIDFGGTGSGAFIGFGDPVDSAPATLTLGTNLTIVHTGANGTYDTQDQIYAGYGPGTLVNDGTITGAAGSGQWEIATDAFVNTNAVTVVAGGGLVIAPAFVNDGTAVVAGGTLYLETGYTGNGTIDVTDGGEVELNGTQTVPSLAAIHVVSGSIANDGLIEGAGNLPGPLDNEGTIIVAGGVLAVDGPLSGSGVLQLNGGATLDIPASETIGGTIDLAANTSPVIDIAPAATLTLGSGAVVTTGADTQATIEGGALVNRGQFVVDGGGYAPVTDDAAEFSNAGTLALNSGGVFQVATGTFTNSGLLNIAPGAAFQLVDAASLANGGSVILNGQLDVYVDATLAGLGSIEIGPSGYLAFSDDTTLTTLDLGGGTLGVGSGSVGIYNDVRHGTIALNGGGLQLSGTLDDVTILGALTVSAAFAIQNGATFEGANGAPGTVDFFSPNGFGSGLDVLDSETLDNVTLDVDVQPQYGESFSGSWYLDASSGATLTLGAGVVIKGSVGADENTEYGYTYQDGTAQFGIGALLVNDGTVDLSAAIDENFASFTNHGTFGVDGLNIAGNLDNTGLITATDFTFDGTGNLVNTGSIAAGLLNLDGASTLASLAGITAGTLAVTGTLDLGGGTLYLGTADAFGALQIAPGGTVENGTIVGADGRLVLESDTGLPAGGATLDSASTLELANGYGTTIDFSAFGNLSGQPTLLIDADETLDLHGGTLEIGAGGAFSAVVVQGSLESYTVYGYQGVTPGGAIMDGTIIENGAPLTLNDGATLVDVSVLDLTPPVVTQATVATDTGATAVNAGHVITVTLDFSEPVDAIGELALTLNDGGIASYQGGAGTPVLTFTTTVAPGQDAADLTVTGLANGGALANIAGIPLASMPTEPLGIAVDTETPNLTSVTASPSSGVLKPGQSVSITLRFSAPVAVSGGVPTLTLSTGGLAVFDASATAALDDPTALLFRDTIEPTDVSTANPSVVSFEANGATVTDAAGNVADFSAAFGRTLGFGVDTAAATTTQQEVFFVANAGTAGPQQVYSVSGTSGATLLVAAGFTYDNPTNLTTTPVGTFFVASSSYSYETIDPYFGLPTTVTVPEVLLIETDGTGAGTNVVRTLTDYSGEPYGDEQNFQAITAVGSVGNTVLILASDTFMQSGSYSSTYSTVTLSTNDGTTLTSWYLPLGYGFATNGFVTAGPVAYFLAPSTDSSIGIGTLLLWQTDGTAAGTHTIMLSDGNGQIDPGNGTITDLTASGDTLFFVDNGTLFAAANGSAIQLASAEGGTFGVAAMAATGSGLYFVDTGGGLWYTDGSSGGTVALRPDGTFNDATSLVLAGNRLFVIADAPGSSATPVLWTTTGSAASTETLTAADGSVGAPASLTAVGGQAFFVATDTTGGSRLWRSDGTALGTTIVSPAGDSLIDPADLVANGDTLVFQAYDDANGTQLWQSDGTAAGTTLLADVAGGSYPTDIVVGASASAAATSGVALDGYIAGATVFADANGNGQWDPGEAETTTNAAGQFTLAGGSGPLVLVGGTDSATNLAFNGRLAAPAGSTTVTPLTTLVEALASGPAALSVAAAEQAVAGAFGLTLPERTALDDFDPIAGLFAGTPGAAASFAAGTEVLDSITMAAAALGGLDATLSPTQASADVLAALAGEIGANPGGSLDLTNPATVGSLFSAAAALDPASPATPSTSLVNQVATVIAAGNAAASQAAQGTTPGDVFISDSAVARLAQGSVAAALADPSAIDTTVALYTGTALSQAVANAANSVTPCFCPGTLILTPAGERPIETLEIGDRVVTMSGRVEPIRWIGRRSYAGAFVANRRDILPVCVKAGALADGVPRRDLWLSPLHALLLGEPDLPVPDLLVPVGALVNGRSIVQAERVESVRYLHIELLHHDVIIADGASAETFVDDGGRTMFHNAASYARLYGANAAGEAIYCAPRSGYGPRVDAIWHVIAARAGLLVAKPKAGIVHGFLDAVVRTQTGWEVRGWAQRRDAPALPVCIEVMVAGRVVARVLANEARPDLELAGIGDGRHGFCTVMPGMLQLERPEVQAICPLDDSWLPFSDAFWGGVAAA